MSTELHADMSSTCFTSFTAFTSFSEDLFCSICLCIFTDPVSLPCGHSFCRECIRIALNLKANCPYCQVTAPNEETYLATNYILKSLAEKLQAEETPMPKKIAYMCPEHGKKLSLFRLTDKRIICIMCMDGNRPEEIKPIKEAADFLRQQLEDGYKTLDEDIAALQTMGNTQKTTMSNAENECSYLLNVIVAQFDVLHQFLDEKQNELTSELGQKRKEAVGKMTLRLKNMADALDDARRVEAKVKFALGISDHHSFLQSWYDGVMTAPEASFSSRAQGLQVSSESCSMGPYGSHLQFFVWKEMLQVMTSLPTRISLRGNNANISVSDDGRTLQCAPKTPLGNGSGGYYTNKYSTSSTKLFTSGQHYWEIEVGQRDFWELGVGRNLLRHKGEKLYAIHGLVAKQLSYKGCPRKIGVYLDCSSKQLSFYNADDIELIYTKMSCTMSLPEPAYFNIKNSGPPNPMTVCWY